MKLRFFSVPVQDSQFAETELNAFLASHRVVSLERKLIDDGARSMWALCVEYVEATSEEPFVGRGRGKVDYRAVLSEPDFALFARLRDLRKRLAENENVPPYALFTNEQLAAMVRGNVTTKAGLESIEGVGQAKVRKYGEVFLAELGKSTLTTSKESEDDAAT